MMARQKKSRNLFLTNVHQRLMTVKPTRMRQFFEKTHPEKKL
jgi:hypothetical protein